MTHTRESARIADEPLEVRREAEIARKREIDEGFDRQRLTIAEDERFRTAVALARVPDLAAKLSKD